jgi:membrane peptidoglycan carboxypeptidase
MPPLTLRHSLTRLLPSAVMVGVVVAVAALPAATLGGIALLYATSSFEDLPSELRIPPTAQASSIYANDGKTLLTTFFDENRRDVPLTRVARVMQQAIVAAEDARFYEHGAVDLRGVVRSLVADLRGGRVEQGASTLTMQYVRNVLKEDPNLTPQQRLAATADAPGRKLREVRYAIALESKLSKQDILDRYLNIAYFGAGAYGIYAAAQTYFSEQPSQLTLAQSALLAGLVQAPDTDSPITGDLARALKRRTYVLHAMAKANVISPAQALQVQEEPMSLRPHQNRNGCTATTHAAQGWGFFCDYLRQWWDTRPEFGTTPQQRDRALREGGYTIVTSLDPTVQAAALRQSLAVYGYQSRRALPMAVVQPGTGRVLALVVNRHYSLTGNPKGRANHPNTVNQLIAGGGGVTGYESGSTFKLFTMLAALTAGAPLDTPFDAPSQLVTRWPSSGPASCHGHYCPVMTILPGWTAAEPCGTASVARSTRTLCGWRSRSAPIVPLPWPSDSASPSGPRRTLRWRGTRPAAGDRSRSEWRTPRLWISQAHTRRSRPTAGTAHRYPSCRLPIRAGSTSRLASPNVTRRSIRMLPMPQRTRPAARSGSSRRSTGATVAPPPSSRRSSVADRLPVRPEVRRTTRPRLSSG